MLLIKAGGAASIGEWQVLFAELKPGLAVRWWDDAGVDPRSVSYVLVWEPEPGRLKQYPNLKAVFSTGAGVDHITSDPDWPRHLPLVRMASPQTAQTVGEYVAMAALMLLRDQPRMAAAQRNSTWDNFEPAHTALTVRAGILGLGNMGRRAAAMLQGLGFPVSGWSRERKAIAGVICHAGLAELDGFLAQTDILIGLLPDTPLTRGLIDARRMAQLPKGASIINTGRGSLIVLADLVAALKSGHVRSAMLDVLEVEPLTDGDPLWRHPRLTITPHLAGYATRRARAAYVAQTMSAFERGEALANVYLPSRGY